jgi:HK97 family phage major capsid protein
MERFGTLVVEQARLMDFSGALATMDDAGGGQGYGGGGGGHVRLRAFKGPDAAEKAFASGQWLRWRLLGNEFAGAWCQNHPNLVRLGEASESINSAGGFLVPDVLTSAIIDLREEYGVARRECDVVPMTSDNLSIPKRAGGLQAFFVGESSEITDSTAAWDLVSLVVKKLAVLTRMSSELNDDAVISMAEQLTSEIAFAFAMGEDSALWNGDGTSPYGGIVGIRTKLTAASGLAGAVAAATAAHDTFPELDASDVQQLMAALPEQFDANAKWYCSGKCWGTVFARLLMAATGNAAVDLSAGLKRQYMGYPIVTSPKMPANNATDYTGLAMILFGNMRMAAKFGSRRGMTIQLLKELYAASDQIALKFTERFDINVHGLGTTAATGTLTAVVGGSG